MISKLGLIFAILSCVFSLMTLNISAAIAWFVVSTFFFEKVVLGGE